MKNMTVGDLKAGFSKVLKDVEAGQEIVICYGKSKKKVAVIVPYEKYYKKPPIKLGLLEGIGKVTFSKDFKMTDEEFLNS